MAGEVPSNIYTSGVYIGVNTNTERAGLLPNNQRVLFITDDEAPEDQTIPVDTYDKASADAIFGEDSIAGVMMKAAIKTNMLVRVQAFAVGEP